MAVALKMLVWDRTKFAGIVLGLTFASLLIAQQGAIFVGIVYRTFGVISDAGYADIWVMDPQVEVIDDTQPIQNSQLAAIQSIPGVACAAPLVRSIVSARLGDGRFQTCSLMGLDDKTLMGGPPAMVRGKLIDLRRMEGVIVDELGASGKLAVRLGDGRTRPLAIGDTLELNEHRAVVVGICRVTRSFQSQPVIYSSYSRAVGWGAPGRSVMTFVLVKARAGIDMQALCRSIHRHTGLGAYTAHEFRTMTAQYVIRHTGIFINFAIGIGMGILVGTAIAGQAFYNFILDNRSYFSALKAMGMRRRGLLGMILIQAVVAGFIGFGCGIGLASAFGYATRNTELAFVLTWQLLVISIAAVLLICVGAALASIIKVLRLQPAAVFRA